MKLIVRVKDNLVMNDRIRNDWRDIERLTKLKKEYKDLSDNSLKPQMKAQIAPMEMAYHKWVESRLLSIVRQYGGVANDYTLVSIEPDDIIDAMTAKYITYNGKVFTYNTSPRFAIEKNNPGQITVFAPQWVKGNHALLEDDTTDFREEEFKADMFFSLEFWQMASTKDIVVELFLWGPLEDKGEPPKGKTFCHVICSGIYHHDTRLIEVR